MIGFKLLYRTRHTWYTPWGVSEVLLNFSLPYMVIDLLELHILICFSKFNCNSMCHNNRNWYWKKVNYYWFHENGGSMYRRLAYWWAGYWVIEIVMMDIFNLLGVFHHLFKKFIYVTIKTLGWRYPSGIVWKYGISVKNNLKLYLLIKVNEKGCWVNEYTMICCSVS